MHQTGKDGDLEKDEDDIDKVQYDDNPLASKFKWVYPQGEVVEWWTILLGFHPDSDEDVIVFFIIYYDDENSLAPGG